MNFIDTLLEYTKDAESPTSYFKWAGYTSLAAVLRNSVWIDRVYHKVYPNIYTLILSRRSSLVKKSTPLKTALKLIYEVDNTKVVAGRATIAGIVNVLTTPKTTKAGKQLNDAVGLIYAEELTSLIMEDHYATDTLTDWYDGHSKWTSHLSMSGTGSVPLENLCLSMLTSSNEELVRSVFDSRAMQGGLLARTFLIIESEKRQKNSLMYVPKRDTESAQLTNHLFRVAQMKGEMILEDEARQFFHEWYNEFEPINENSSTTGVEGRIDTHVLKLAILKSAAERFDRVITKKHIENAIYEVLELLPNYALFATGSAGPLEKLGREMLLLLLEAKDYILPKRKIIFALFGHGQERINETIETLSEAGMVNTLTDKNGDFCLQLTKTFLRRLEQEDAGEQQNAERGTAE